MNIERLTLNVEVRGIKIGRSKYVKSELEATTAGVRGKREKKMEGQV